MELTLKNDQELSRLTNYFQGIEEIADTMGIDVDDLVTDRKARNQNMYIRFKRNVLSMARRRQELLMDYHPSTEVSGDASILEMIQPRIGYNF
ncbi:MAG: hypothetical protein IT242_11000 [Bacteroidia bacterium]|nr:hypothetical protein [Bacteroidia bacterium]